MVVMVLIVVIKGKFHRKQRCKFKTMKTKVKKEQKKHPYHRQKHNIFTQIRAREQRKALNLPNYAIIDKKGNIIEKYRLRWTADKEIKKLEKEIVSMTIEEYNIKYNNI